MRRRLHIALGCLLASCGLAVLAAACGRTTTGGQPGAGDDAGNGAACADCSGTCLAGRCLTEIVTGSAPPGPEYIAVNGTDLYWATTTSSFNQDTGAIGMAPLDGGAPVVLASSMRPTGIALDETSLYWTNDKSFGGGDAAVLKMPLGGGPVTTLASALQSASAIALDAANVYFLGETGIGKVAKGGGPVVSVLSVSGSPFANTPAALATDTATLYWFQACDGGSCLTGMPLGGDASAPVTLFSATPLESFGGIAAASGSAYFSLLACDTAGACGASLVQAPSSGGAAVTLASGFAFYSSVAVDSTHAYLGGNRCSDADPSCPNAAWRVAVDGGELVSLATGPTGAFAVDDASVYWTEGNGRVARLAPK